MKTGRQASRFFVHARAAALVLSPFAAEAGLMSYAAVHPPSIDSIAPVIDAAASPAR